LRVSTTTSSVELIWIDNSDDEESFVIERTEDRSGPWEELADLPANSTSYVLARSSVIIRAGGKEGWYWVEAVGPSFYRVKARNICGDSEPSNVLGTAYELPTPTSRPTPTPTTTFSTRVTQEMAIQQALAQLTKPVPELCIDEAPRDAKAWRVTLHTAEQWLPVERTYLDRSMLVWFVQAKGVWRTCGIVPPEWQTESYYALAVIDAQSGEWLADKFVVHPPRHCILGNTSCGSGVTSTPTPRPPSFGIQTAEELRRFIDDWWESSKIVINKDIIVLLSSAAAFIYHIPSLSVVSVFPNDDTDYHKDYGNDEGAAALEAVLDDETLMQQIRARIQE
jgi:hypothetical protein